MAYVDHSLATDEGSVTIFHNLARRCQINNAADMRMFLWLQFHVIANERAKQPIYTQSSPCKQLTIFVFVSIYRTLFAWAPLFMSGFIKRLSDSKHRLLVTFINIGLDRRWLIWNWAIFARWLLAAGATRQVIVSYSGDIVWLPAVPEK